MMFDPKNPDWTKTYKEREKLREFDFNLWWNVEHQYPYQHRLKPIRRKWLNPFYCQMFAVFWLSVRIKETEKQK